MEGLECVVLKDVHCFPWQNVCGSEISVAWYSHWGSLYSVAV